VATIRALKYNGGIPKDKLSVPDIEALKRGIVNLEKHIENLKSYNVPVVVTLNAFVTDSDEETEFVENFCKERGASFALSKVWEFGGEGGVELAKTVVDTIEHKESHFAPIYETDLPVKDKIEAVARKIYGADGVDYDSKALKNLEKINALGFDKLPVCMAKTQYSLSDDPSLLGRPSGFKIKVRDMYISAGAGFIVVLTGDIMTMPGLPKKPAALSIDTDDNGEITGLF
jgi:formate--tetrahydrofolate ligase